VKVVKKINNNVAIGIDGNDREVILFGKGIGFPSVPYELTDLSRIQRTFYDIDRRYYAALAEIPENTFMQVSRLLETVKMKLTGELNPNLVFVLSDHINFAVERYRKGIDVGIPYSYEMEYQYPEIVKVAKWFVEQVNETMEVNLKESEVTSIAIHFLNAMDSQQRPRSNQDEGERLSRMIKIITHIVEEYFQVQVDTASFAYFRFKNHLKFFVQRKTRGEEFTGENEELYDKLKEEYPDVAECVGHIDDYLMEEFGERCPREELLYLMIHVNQLYTKESGK
jgi:beta-glucoside operon transcriptional antiterminator